MEKKPRTTEVHNIIKTLLDSEIPEIQAMAKKLADQIKKLEEHSLKLHDYLAQIEELTTEEATTIVEGRINELLQGLDKALGELKQRSKKTAVTRPEVVAAPPTRAMTRAKAEREEIEAEEPEEPEGEIAPGSGHMLERYTTPEGYVIKKARH